MRLKLGVTALVKIQEGYVLIGNKEGYPGLLLLPGGRIEWEQGESVEHAAEREIEEETGLQVSELRFRDYIEWKRPERGDQGIAFVFSATGKGTPRPGGDAGSVHVLPARSVARLSRGGRLSPITMQTLRRVWPHLAPNGKGK